MTKITVPKGGAGITTRTDEGLAAVCLGSTLAVCVSDSRAGISAITVPLLPSLKGLDSSTVNGVYLDVTSGLKEIFQKITDAGGSRRDLRIWLVGAAAFMNEPKELSLGVQIYAAVKKILKKNGLKIHAEHVGGSFDRSVFLEAGADVLTVVMPEGREITI